MSPVSPDRVRSSTELPALQVKKEEDSPRPIVILSELDSYIAERMKSQPATLEDIANRVAFVESPTRHRLELPDYFQRLSYDHAKQPGAFVFKWIFKDKRSIDRHLNVLGWTLVNRVYFPEAPRYLFTASGGVEIGDALLGFMPAKKALEVRAAPGKRSIERIKSQVTNVGADYAMMTGNPKDEKVYQPEMGPEATETTEGKVPGVLTEGRDF